MTRGLGLKTALGERGSQPEGIWTSNGQQEVKEERKSGSAVMVASGAQFMASVYTQSQKDSAMRIWGEKMTFRL